MALVTLLWRLCALLAAGGSTVIGAHTGLTVDMGALQNVSQVIEDLLDGYDIRLRPQFGGKPGIDCS